MSEFRLFLRIVSKLADGLTTLYSGVRGRVLGARQCILCGLKVHGDAELLQACRGP